MKKIKITESQYKELITLKRNEAKIAGFIKEDIDKLKTKLNESLLDEGVVDVLKSYVRRGVLTAGIIASLLASNHVNAQQLQTAGVSPQAIEQAMNISNKGGGQDNKSIENTLLKNLKKAGHEGTIRAYNNLPQDQKDAALNYVKTQIDAGKDIKSIIIGINGFVNNAPQDKGSIIGTKSEKKITVSTVQIAMKLPLKQGFAFNSAELEESFKLSLKDSANSFMKIDSIVIKASSSTLRNTGEAEGLTWKELSQKRANAVAETLVGMEYNLGGCGANPSQKVDAGIIKYDIDGDNGDGTSGPPSPYEVNPSVVQSYKEKGIDPKFWDSQAQGEALANKADYEQFHYVDVIIYGHVVETDTTEIISFKYIVLKTEQKGGTIKKTKSGAEKVDIGSCPIQQQKTKVRTDFSR